MLMCLPEKGVDTFHPWLDTGGSCIGRYGLPRTPEPRWGDWVPCGSLHLCCGGPKDWSGRLGIGTIPAHKANHMVAKAQNLHIHLDQKQLIFKKNYFQIWILLTLIRCVFTLFKSKKRFNIWALILCLHHTVPKYTNQMHYMPVESLYVS